MGRGGTIFDKRYRKGTASSGCFWILILVVIGVYALIQFGITKGLSGNQLLIAPVIVVGIIVVFIYNALKGK
jgi:hypothetical protein